MTDLAVLGGSGLSTLEGLRIIGEHRQKTPYGEASAPLTLGSYAGKEIIFMPRHGHPHVIPPHKVNYRANLWALKENGVQRIISINAVGGITGPMRPCRLVIPDQIIDYTWGRPGTFFEDGLASVTHVDFTRPYNDALRILLIDTAEKIKLDIYPTGTYGVTQGPRLESAAEIKRLERDGCDIVGMTGMPEAVLARELDIAYAHCAFVVNWAAGKGDGSVVSMEEINRNLISGSEAVRELLAAVLPQLL